MQRKWFVILLVCMEGLMLGCTDDKRYVQILDRAQEQNLNRETITDIDSIQMAAKYYDRHGSNNDKVRAYYLLGCAYRDAGEAPNALEAFHDAADRADTTSADCDYGLLMRVHAQSAELFRYQLLPYEVLEELEAQRRCAIKAGNTKASINAIERSAEAYQLLNMPDSIISFRMRASTMYEQCGYPEEAVQTLSACIEPLVDRGDTAEARWCIERYETSKEFFKDGEILPRKAIHYYNKGKYYLAVGKTDSAEVCFRKLIEPGRNAQQLEAGYRGLFLLYRTLWARCRATHRGQAPLCSAGYAQDGASPHVSSPHVSSPSVSSPSVLHPHVLQVADSMAKYADLQYEQTIPALADKNAERVQQIQGLYNYSRIEHKEKQTAEKNEQQKDMIIILLVAVIALALVAVCVGKLLGYALKRPVYDVKVNTPGNFISNEIHQKLSIKDNGQE